jgi:hypothetical protein
MEWIIEENSFWNHGGELEPEGGCLIDGCWRRAAVEGDNGY